MPIYRLIDLPVFPRPELADESGLLAVGGDLSVSRLIEAYRLGIFPWYDEDQPILWWSPDPRLILELDELHISRSLKKAIRRGGFEIHFDRDFEGVLQGCSGPRRKEEEEGGTWLIPEMCKAYQKLHALGIAHSVEVWQDGALVGGLYGVAMGRAFFGESMFSRVSNGSKVALVALVAFLKGHGGALLDCQVTTDHLCSMGAKEIPRSLFLTRLREALGPGERLPQGSWEHFSPFDIGDL